MAGAHAHSPKRLELSGYRVPGRPESAPPHFVAGAAGVVITVMLTASLVILGARDTALVVLGVLAVAGFVGLLRVDLAWLPAIALVGFALFPLSYLPLQTHDGLLNVSSAIIVIFAIRAIRADRPLPIGRTTVPLVLLLLWVVIATLISSEKATSASWSVPFLLLVGIPGLLLPGWGRATAILKSTWIILGGVLGAYGILEFVLRHNLVYGRYFAAYSLNQPGTLYRITTTLGHPITNGLFFALATLLGVAAYANGRRGFVLPCTVVSLIATFLSFSRGPYIGLGVGLVILAWQAVATGRVVLTRRRLGIGLVLLVVLAGGGYTVTSLRGTEGQISTQAHLETLTSGEQLVGEYFPWGGGPGLADTHKRDLASGDKQRGVESSPLQLAISLGLPGILLMCWVLISVLGTAFAVGRADVAACLITYVVSTATYNVFEANRPALLILGVLIAFAGADLGPSPRRATDRRPRRGIVLQPQPAGTA